MFLRVTITLCVTGLLHVQQLRSEYCNGTTFLKYKSLECERGRGCPNTFKCIKGECCEYKDVPRCEPEMNSDTGAPWPCKGPGSKRCSPDHICVTAHANLYSLCCLNVTCVDSSGFSHKWYDKPWISNDKCNKCRCPRNERVKCTNRKACRKCLTPHGIKKIPFQYWKDRCTRCTCKSKMYTSCTTACERGLKDNLTDYTPCGTKGCGKQVAVQQCHGAVGADGNPCVGNSFAIRTCNEDKCTSRPGKRLTEATSILRIIGGTEVNPKHNVPWMVLIESPGCGGTLISPRHVLTAAHCVDYMREITLKTGKHDKTKEEGSEQTRVVTRSNFIIHPYYNRNNYDCDIAIVIVDPPIELNKYTQPVLLPKHKDTTLNGKRCQVTGWGRRAIDDRRGSSVLQEVVLEKEKTCNLSKDDSERLTENMFCASANGKDSCFGDSGGPFACRDPKTNCWTQYGIVSWGPSGSCGVMSGVYTKVSNYIGWIDDIISTDGGWGEWTTFTDCKNGVKSRARICTNPEPIVNGKCKGIGKVSKDVETGLYVDIDTVDC